MLIFFMNSASKYASIMLISELVNPDFTGVMWDLDPPNIFLFYFKFQYIFNDLQLTEFKCL